MARYVDGFLVPVPKKNLGVYRRMAQKAGSMLKGRDACALLFRRAHDRDIDLGITQVR